MQKDVSCTTMYRKGETNKAVIGQNLCILLKLSWHCSKLDCFKIKILTTRGIIKVSYSIIYHKEKAK